MEETGPDAEYRNEHLSATEQRWAIEQRQLRTHLITHDQLDFAWPPAAASAPLAVAASVEIDECKSDSEAASSTESSVPKPPLTLVGGVDISFVGEGEDDDKACAALVVLEYPSLNVVYEHYEMIRLTQPYIAGFLAFREVEHLLNLLDRLRSDSPHLFPQIILTDGNGILHHRGFGCASHFGVLANIPTIGVGKNLLLVDGLDRSVMQQRANETLKKGGENFDLVGTSGTVWGSCLRATDAASSPIFVSIGHRISLPTAVDIVHHCCKNRIPEPVRLADLNSREFIRKWKASGAVMPPVPATATSAASTTAASSGSSFLTDAAVDPTSLAPVSNPIPSSTHEQKHDAESRSNTEELQPQIASIASSASSSSSSSSAISGVAPNPTVLDQPRPLRQQSDPTDTRSATSYETQPRERSKSNSRGPGTYVPAERTPACIIS